MRLLPLLLTLLILAGPAEAARTPSPCQKLERRHHDRAPQARLVLVERGSAEAGRVSACILPRGRVKDIAAVHERDRLRGGRPGADGRRGRRRHGFRHGRHLAAGRRAGTRTQLDDRAPLAG